MTEKPIDNELFEKFPALDPAYPSPINLRKAGMSCDYTAPTLANAVYAMKHPGYAGSFVAVSPKKAAELDKTVPTPGNWDAKRLEAMELMTCQKFEQNPDLAWQLFDTYPDPIYAVWGSWDYSHSAGFGNFWGYPGQNKLGEILTRTRDRLLKQIPRVTFRQAQSLTGGPGSEIEIRFLGQKNPVRYANSKQATHRLSVYDALMPDMQSKLDPEKTLVIQIQPVLRCDENPYAHDDGEEPDKFICYRFVCM